MTQYNTLNVNVELSNSQLNKFKFGIKIATKVTLNFSSDLIRNYDETNFPHNILLTDTKVLKIHKAFANGSSAILQFSKTQLSKMIQSGGVVIHGTSTFGNVLSSIAEKGTNTAKNIRKIFLDN